MDRLNEGFTLLMDGMRQFADGIRLMAEGMEALNTRLVNIERWATIRFQTPRRYVVIASSPGTPYGIPIAMSGWTPTPPAYHPATPQAPVRPRRQMGICSRGRRGRRGGVGANIRPISPTWSQREQPLSVASSTSLSTLTPSPGPQLSPSNYVESCSNCIEPFRLEDFLPSPKATSMPAQEGEGEAAPTMPVQEGEEEAAPHMPVHEGGEEAAPSKPAQEGEEEEGI